MNLNDAELKKLPFSTLRQIASQLAADIDAGEEDKKPLLETIFIHIAKAK